VPEYPHQHSWDVSEEEARQIQSDLRRLVQRTNGFELSQIKTVAGVDISLKDEGQVAVVVLSFTGLQLLDQAVIMRKVTFPYIPGLLSFRETPLALEAIEKLKVQPDLFMLDGQGIAHPRRFGIACHLGVLLDRPTIGCAKSVLIGHYEKLGPNLGDQAEMRDGEETVGVALRTKVRTKPMIISIGHKIDLPTAVEVVMKCARGYRLPETTRMADKLSRAAELLPISEPTSEDDLRQGKLFSGSVI
jgi:deoxyribonuclease V